jgi:hypothetical protein
MDTQSINVETASNKIHHPYQNVRLTQIVQTTVTVNKTARLVSILVEFNVAESMHCVTLQTIVLFASV